MINLMQGDCLELMKTIPDGSVDLILTDPPYGTVKNIGDSDSINHGMKNKTGWDETLDFDLMWSEINRVLRKNGKCILFSQEPFTSNLIKSSIPSMPFLYRCIWLKDHFANSLIAKKAPVNYFEDILVFNKHNSKNEVTHNPIREYFKKERLKTNMPLTEINRIIFGCTKGKDGTAGNILSSYKKGWKFPTKENFEKLRFIGLCLDDYDELKRINDIHHLEMLNNESYNFPSVFNLIDGKKYKSNVFEYKKDYSGLHPTQKPVALLEDLIKTYSNSGNTALDFTMGSGSTGVACINTNRNFIGIELDQKYFEIAKNRIESA